MQKMQKVGIKSVLGFGLVLLLTGCSGSRQPQVIEISSKPVDKPTLTLPPVDELQLRPVEWIVINEENVDQVIQDLKDSRQPTGLFALTGKSYGNLGLNFSDIRALVQQQKAIIVAYENYYQQAEKALGE